jgi:hypothetical protein
MYPANSYALRPATEADEPTLLRLAELDSQRPLDAPALIGEIRGVPAAAVSLTDGRVVADPFKSTLQLRQILRLRFNGFRAYSRAPSQPQRLRGAISTVPATRAAADTH